MDDERRAWVRRSVIAALCSDDELMEQLVLKGGNALDLVHGIGGRTSIDLDYSMEADFTDVDHARMRLQEALQKQFSAWGFKVIDFKFAKRPVRGGKEYLSGYHVDFKLAGPEAIEKAGEDPAKLSRSAETVAPGHVRKVEIQISKYEYCIGSEEIEVPGLEIPLRVRVYTPAMIVAEKLRSLCQQMPEYRNPERATARARDFYDIHTAVTGRNVDIDTDEFRSLVREVFKAKKVPLALIGKIKEHREFHRVDWSAVENTVRDRPPGDFDFYFDFTVKQARKLEALWMENTP